MRINKIRLIKRRNNDIKIIKRLLSLNKYIL